MKPSCPTDEKRFVNTIKIDNSRRKVKKIALTFDNAVKEIDDPRTKSGAIDYPLVEILFTALVAVVCGASSYPEMNMIINKQFYRLRTIRHMLQCQAFIRLHRC